MRSRSESAATIAIAGTGASCGTTWSGKTSASKPAASARRTRSANSRAETGSVAPAQKWKGFIPLPPRDRCRTDAARPPAPRPPRPRRRPRGRRPGRVPRPTIVTTRPPLDSQPPPARRVPAWKQSRSPSSAAARRLDALDGAAANRVVGVALGGDHHAQRCAVAQPERSVEAATVPGGDAEQGLGQVAVEQRQQDLRLGVAEAGVELEDHRSGIGQHQPGVQHAAVRGPVARHAPGDRLEDGSVASSSWRRPNHGHRRIGAHAAGVRAGVAVAQTACSRSAAPQRHDVLAAHEGEGAHLAPGEPLLEEDAAALRRDVEQVAQRARRLVPRLGHDHALARRQPVRLHDRRPLPRVEVGLVGAAAGDRCRRSARRRAASPPWQTPSTTRGARRRGSGRRRARRRRAHRPPRPPAAPPGR